MGCFVSGHAGPDFHDLYFLGAVVGTGSFAQTRRVTRVTDGSEALVKIVDLRTKESHMREAVNEAQIWGCLGKHAHIVELLELFEDLSFYYFVMELCDEGFMQHLELMTRVTEWTLAPVLYEVFHALAHLHVACVVHCDVKPNNFFFKNGVLKLSDFGLSTRYVFGDDDRPSGLVGHVPYMSPEMIQGIPYDFKTDVWSAGVIAYLLMYGETPYSAKQYSALAGAMAIRRGNTQKIKDSHNTSMIEGTSDSGVTGSTSNLNTQEQLKAVIKDGRQLPPYRPFNEDDQRPPLTSTTEAFLHSLLMRDVEKRPFAKAALELDFLSSPPSAGALESAPCLRAAIAQAALLVHKHANSAKQPAAWKSAAKLLMSKQRAVGHKPKLDAPEDPPFPSTSADDAEEQMMPDDTVPTPPLPLPSDKNRNHKVGGESPHLLGFILEGATVDACAVISSQDIPWLLPPPSDEQPMITNASLRERPGSEAWCPSSQIGGETGGAQDSAGVSAVAHVPHPH